MSEGNSAPENLPKLREPSTEKGKKIFWDELRKEEKAQEAIGETTSIRTRYRMARKVTAERLRADNAIEKAGKDTLTGLKNLKGFNKEFNRIVADFARIGSQRELTLLTIDVDDLKKMNDTDGHEAGNELLRRVATAMEATGRSTDVIGRIGGDEFLIALPDSNEEDSLEFSKRLKENLGSGGHISIGIAQVDYRSPEMIEASKLASDQAMYWAKTMYKEGQFDRPVVAGEIPTEYVMEPKKLEERANRRQVVEYTQKAG